MQNIYFSDDHSFAGDYDYLCFPTVHLLRKERMDFHADCIFSYNILVMVTEQDKNAETIFQCLLCGKTSRLKKGHFYFIPAGHKVRYDILPDTTYYTTHTGFEYLPGVDCFGEKDLCLEGNAEEEIRRMDQIWTEKDPLKQTCRIHEFLLHFYLQHWPEKYSEKRPDESMLPILKYINTNANALLSVENLAERAGMNIDVFSRKFRKNFGILPKKYISQIVFQKICRLLQHGDRTLESIASELHFSSGFYLSRFVKRQCGVSPAVYRNRLHVNEF